MAEKAIRFTAELIASCGMNCALCSHYLARVKQAGGPHRITECPGCRASGRGCAVKRNCVLVGHRGMPLCSECAEFPCPSVKHLDARYRNRYGYSMVETIAGIKSKGMPAVLAEQRERHKCPRCGGVICIHNGKCYRCDEVKSWRG